MKLGRLVIATVLVFGSIAAAPPCLNAATTATTVTPTPPPPSACVPIPCGGDCVVRPPCTPDTACPQYVVKGTCEVVYNTCMCVTNSQTPPPTPTFGGCGLSCDERPCLGQCADGSTVQGFCSSLTVDRGCACSFGCATPTRTPSPFAVCTPPPCHAAQVFYCPGNCPGGCGTECATPTASPTVTPTPAAPCTNVPCGGPCTMCPPCTPGTICPLAPCYLGTCQVIADTCACVPGVPTPTPTPPGLPVCVGDCGGDGRVTVEEIVRLVAIALNGEPGPNPCPGADQWCSAGPVASGVTITCVIEAVNNALNGCPGAPPRLALSVRVARNPDTQVLDLIADLTNGGDVPVGYLAGCSGRCRPKMYRAISFELIGPRGNEVIVENPCGGVLLCPEGPQALGPGQSLEQTLVISGTHFIQNATPDRNAGECGSCTQVPLEPGRYKVTARFQYATSPADWPFLQSIEASAQFDWP